MRINKYVAFASGLSRRAADDAITAGRVRLNDQLPISGQSVGDGDVVTLDGQPLVASIPLTTIMLNKPVGYVCSRQGQGSNTVYDLLPPELHHLKSVGRLDKESSGLLLLTNDGALAHRLTHPSFQKVKVYDIAIHKPLAPADKTAIEHGVQLVDGVSHLQLSGSATNWKITMHEGRNRQIRRTFAALGYETLKLHRTNFGDYALGSLPIGNYTEVNADSARDSAGLPVNPVVPPK